MTPVEVKTGNGPIVLGFPHTGTDVPENIFTRLTPLGQTLADTDWHIHTLYNGLLGDVTTVRATFHRYVIDANRDPTGASLYPGQNTTGLVPVTDFDGRPLWLEPPSEAEIGDRCAQFHFPYHNALNAEIERVRHQHGIVILFDCHSIRSNIPFLFEGILPDFNIGTNDGTTCAHAIEQTVYYVCAAASGYTSVLNGRFKGGWTTRHYGRPGSGIHAIQMELAQSTYLKSETRPYDYEHVNAERLRTHLKTILQNLAACACAIASRP